MQKIVIVDFGGQYTHLIARRIRNLGVFSEISNPEDLKIDSDIIGLIFSGGPKSVVSSDAFRLDVDLNSINIPILGICYGHQLLNLMLGGKVESGLSKEYGFTHITCQKESILFKGITGQQQVWMSHGDHVKILPANCRVTAASTNIRIAAFESLDGMFFGVQFHPEVTHTLMGMKMLDNFVSQCTDTRDWKAENYVGYLISKVQRLSENKNLILLLSGGVDSLVTLELCARALDSSRVFSIHVDTGLMRKNESSEIMNHFRNLGYTNLKIIEAEEVFLSQLSGIIDPEKKRAIIGKLFVDLVHKELNEKIDRENNWMLVQGTIYPDTIESGDTDKSAKIKTHHNRVKEIEQLIEQGRVIEPISELYKDEVRSLGLQLNLPEDLVQRQPFPGPGLAIRLLASDGIHKDTKYDLEEEKLKDILIDYELKGFILPVKSVGVQGDFRTYNHPAVIWNNGHKIISWRLLRKVSSELVNNLRTVNRVCFSSLPLKEKPTLTKNLITKENLNELRDIDAFFRFETGHLTEIWQMPVISLPLTDEFGKVFVIRPVSSQDAMTADFYEMDFNLLKNLTSIARVRFRSGRVYYDITSKPPGTIEWE